MCKQDSNAPLKNRGFSLFEMLVVMIVISILVYMSFDYYLSTIENSKHSVIKFQAGTFARTVENLSGEATLRNTDYVVTGIARVYMNQFGWPASSDTTSSLSAYNQTPEECQKLWRAMFSNPPSTTINTTDSSLHNIDYKIYSINGRICRYELLRKQEGRYFFDYDLVTGSVTVSIPD
ncbi:type II secretion system protein [Teredinibacter waterburyi]|jgi:prepilin-type N-terminal cleavage/methylation domain|uniref:type II secretion system protein n=1 Tax=Teredinibacter waterburyi TaxID=1500538 RepID=UPI00165F12E5|nr:prepilin-type N-terminal cleavage/methylation domain-containing protein [Teredinibacter waterburyi]